MKITAIIPTLNEEVHIEDSIKSVDFADEIIVIDSFSQDSTVEIAKKHNVKVSVVSPGFIKTPLTDKNEFPMPFLRAPEFAANKVYNGLVKTNSFEIDFPKQLTFTLKFLRILPYKIYLFLVDKLVKR